MVPKGNKVLTKFVKILLFFIFTDFASAKLYTLDDVQKVYLSQLIKAIGNGTSISQTDLGRYFEKNSIKWIVNSSVDSTCMWKDGATLDEKCLLSSCLSPEDVYNLSGLSKNITKKEVSTLSTILLHLLGNHDCEDLTTETEHKFKHHTPPSSLEVWGFGIVCTTVIVVCALTAVIALPFIHGSVYKKVLLFMVGLAVGTLSGSSVLFLIPEALELTDQELTRDSYVWKCLTVILGIYVFFNIERILKMIMKSREESKIKRGKTDGENEDGAIRVSSFHLSTPVPAYKNVDALPAMSPCGNNDPSNSSISEDTEVSDIQRDGDHHLSSIYTTDEESHKSGQALVFRSNHHGHSHAHKKIAPVAWMIIFGDALHNFIDGVSMGAAFTESILAGVSVSLAIFCEELPHELGDFAVLLNAGMTIKKAVLFNFLSATTIYLGLIVGIFLGENTAAHTWVFAFAGGMFLYIALVDMMPEMNSAWDADNEKQVIGGKSIYLLQNLGLLTGFGVMLLMAVYGGHLEQAVRGL